MSQTDPLETQAEAIIEPDSPTALEIAKMDARTHGKIRRPAVPRPVINLTRPKGHLALGTIYLRDGTRDRLARIAYIMGESYSETIKRLSTIDYEPSLAAALLGTLPGEEVPVRDTKVRASLNEVTSKRLERLASRLRLGRARNTAARALDAILDGRAEPVGFPTLEAAAEALRRSPIEALREQAEQLDTVDGKITLRISTLAARGLVDILLAFDQRQNWRRRRLRKIIEAIADLPVTYELVRDVKDIPRLQRPMILSMWVIEKFGKIAMDNLLVERPSSRRPSNLVSATLEYIGQGALQLVHERRGIDSRQALATARRRRSR